MSRLRRELSSAVREVISEQAALDITLATSEVLGNVVRHAYRSGAGRCRLALSWSARGVTVVVEDDGEGFAPQRCDAEGGNLRSDSESGRGLVIARAVVDEMCCTNRPDGGARVELTKEPRPQQATRAASARRAGN